MAVATTPQPWFTSKTLWTLLVGFLINLLQYFKIGVGQDWTVISTMVLSILAIVWRWQANQPLTIDPSAVALPAATVTLKP
jgi:hypothetical protein